MMDDAPHIPRNVVEWLQKTFPNEIPNNLLTLSERATGALHGRREVVAFLEAALQAQEESHVPTQEA
ncbi:hypothetical protein HFN51_04305 [Rhizobium leguminosarum]|nr:hypothetical protein [Rhizobium leguminosarum]